MASEAKPTRYFVSGEKMDGAMGVLESVIPVTSEGHRLFEVGGNLLIKIDISDERGNYPAETKLYIVELGNPLAMLGVDPRFIGVSIDRTHTKKFWLRMSEVYSEEPAQQNQVQEDDGHFYKGRLIVNPPKGTRPC